MSFFCLFWLPLFYLLWRNLTGNTVFSGGVWALLAGSIVAMLQFLLGSLTEPEGFGFSRWINGFVDIIAIPVLAPLLIYLLLVIFRVYKENVDFVGFALLWLIPGGAIRAVSWSAQSDPVHLVLAPILWTAIAVGVPFLAGFARHRLIYVIIPAFLGALIVPFAATFAYWGFYVQKTLWGFLFLLVAAAPMLVATVLSFIRTE
jgi:hypothetical protein